jgi:LemA protein
MIFLTVTAAPAAAIAIFAISIHNRLVRLRNTSHSALADIDVQLKELEDGIESARRYYNAVVRDLNTAVEQFPSNLIASRFDFEQRDFFELETPAVERKPVKVSF